ncbi:hypothetical protein OS493_021624 [Desmophyllum pertusum]|uniref:Uncharacterized protein n=1 Tax=Desmophyllum pertusum TaxID=174260 RepID=A0A9X0CFP8_9CNID|nr:hypothetical protein OS493_021624 [Desmophyllum pertusum]
MLPSASAAQEMALAIQRTIMSCLQPTSSIASAGPASASSPAIASTSQPSTSAAPSQTPQIGSLQVNDEKCRRTQPPGRELLVHYT